MQSRINTDYMLISFDVFSPSKLLDNAAHGAQVPGSTQSLFLFLARRGDDLESDVSGRSDIYLPTTRAKYLQCLLDDRQCGRV